MKEIELTKGMKTIVDDADFEMLNAFKWCTTTGHKTFYAARGVSVGPGKRRLQLMHRVIMGQEPFPRAEMDHINGNGLDNRRTNLRWASKSENRRNEPKRNGYSNKYKGVGKVKNRNKFRAYIRHPETQKQIFLGHWDNEIDAAKAYNKAAIEYHGEFAWLNAV